MKRFQRLILGTLIGLAAGSAQAEMTINWNIPAGGQINCPAGWIEQDFLFRGPSGVTHTDSGSSAFYPANGTAYLQALNGQAPMVITNLQGALFTLLQVDLAEYSTVYQIPHSITFTGYRYDGAIVSQVFRTDGVIDGTGPAADFETFFFSADFYQLQQVLVTPSLFSMDNLLLQVVPEPQAGLLLLLSGAAGLLKHTGRRARQLWAARPRGRRVLA